MKNRIKIFFIIPTLLAGGAERVISFIAQNLDRSKFDVTLIVIGFKSNSKYNVDDINVKYLNKDRVLKSILPIVGLLRKEKPSVVISAISHLNINMGLISVIFPKIKFIGRHTIVSNAARAYKSGQKNASRRKAVGLFSFGYRLLDIVICQSRDMYDDAIVTLGLPKEKLRIINNPITDNFKLKSSKVNNDGIMKFITVARLNKRKGHKRILEALAQLNFPFQYTIVGDGSQKDNLLNLIKELGITDKVIHIPYTTEVPKYLSESDLYLQGSYAEGFPNCILESCSVGTPVIAFKAPGGLNEIIENGINGFLVEDETEFIEKLNIPLEWNSETVRTSVYNKFNKNKILDDYENLIFETISE